MSLAADVVVVGTGAGGATAAEILAQAGLRVVMLEEGGYLTAGDVTLHEIDANAALYYDNGNRTTRDGAIAILQGRTGGGSTTVNWTSSFRTPEQTLNHWAQAHGVKGLGPADLAPWFQRVEKGLNVTPWAVAPNANSAALARAFAVERDRLLHGMSSQS